MLKELVTPQNANVFVGKLGDILYKAVDQPLGMAINWGRMWSLWPVHIETACCSVEFGAASSPRYDVERFGIIEAFGSLRQCDLVVVQGTITRKMAPRLRLVYDQMPEPKYVIAMGRNLLQKILKKKLHLKKSKILHQHLKNHTLIKLQINFLTM